MHNLKNLLIFIEIVRILNETKNLMTILWDLLVYKNIIGVQAYNYLFIAFLA